MLRKNYRAAWVCFCLSVLLWACSITPTADFILGRLESGLTIPQAPQGDVIIMLGGGVYQNTTDLSGRGTPSLGTMERLVTAARLQRRLRIPILVSGGKVQATSTAVAPIARRFLIDLGIPSEKVMIESQSRDTYENALYSQIQCTQRGWKHPILVTSGSHMKRSLYCFDSVGLKVTPYPCGIIVWPQKPFHWRQLLPSAESMNAIAMGLHEWMGRLYYWIRY